MNLPPKKRTSLGQNLSLAAQQTQLQIQHCADCGHYSYPPREVCGSCLSGQLSWQQHSGLGVILAAVELQHSFESYFAARLPWRLVSVQLEGNDGNGPVVYAHCHAAEFQVATKVKIVNVSDPSGAGVFIATGRDSSVAQTAQLLALAGFSEQENK